MLPIGVHGGYYEAAQPSIPGDGGLMKKGHSLSSGAMGSILTICQKMSF